MQAVHGLFLVCFLSVAAGCSSPRAVPPVEPGPQATVDDPAMPVVESGPALTGRQLLEGPGDFHFVEPPVAYVTQQMTFEEAHKYIPMLSPDYAPDVPGGLFRETSVYLVAFRGRWEVTPGGPPGAAPVLYEGCLFVLFTAADGRFVAGGDTTCPGKG